MNKNKGKEVVKLSSLLGPGSLCDGDFVAAGSARIDGTVNGNVRVEGTLILGSEGVINGTVEAMAVQIGGEVNGNIYAPEHAELSSTAKVVGDLTTAVIVIDENAVFQGNISMNVEAPVKKEKEGFFRRNIIKNDRTGLSVGTIVDKNVDSNIESDIESNIESNIESDIGNNMDTGIEPSIEEIMQKYTSEEAGAGLDENFIKHIMTE